MQYRKFSKINLDVSILGFGCMRLPVVDNDDKSSIDRNKTYELFDYAIASGINYFDTAYFYHKLVSENFLGQYIKDQNMRQRMLIATKLPLMRIKEKEQIKDFFSEQLEKLDVEYIDFYLLHAVNAMHWEKFYNWGILDFLSKLKAEGKIRYTGFSIHAGFDTFKAVLDAYDWDMCQIQYNYLDTDVQVGYKGYEYACKKDIPVVVMEPLRGGILAKKLPQDAQDIFQSIDPRLTPAAWAFSWLMNHPGVKTILSGMNTLEQLKENIEIANKVMPNSLSEQKLNAVEKVAEIMKNRQKIKCTTCFYCLPCPRNIPIPMIFNRYNRQFMFEENGNIKNWYTKLLNNDKSADRCIACGQCEQKCPQSIEIINGLKQTHEYFMKKVSE